MECSASALPKTGGFNDMKTTATVAVVSKSFHKNNDHLRLRTKSNHSCGDYL